MHGMVGAGTRGADDSARSAGAAEADGDLGCKRGGFDVVGARGDEQEASGLDQRCGEAGELAVALDTGR